MTTTEDRSRSVPLLLGVAAVVLVLDQLTKAWAIDRLARGDIELVFDWRLHLVRNPAAAFSLGEGLGPLIGVLALGVVAALVVMSRDYVGRIPTALVGMIVGGAVGNIADRLFRSSDGLFGGEVIDFVDVRFWPVFNVADSAVVLGVIGLAVYSVFFDPARHEEDDIDAPDGPSDETAGADDATLPLTDDRVERSDSDAVVAPEGPGAADDLDS